MKKLFGLVSVGILLFMLALASNTLGASALSEPDTDAVAPTSPPAVAGGAPPSTISQAPHWLPRADMVRQAQSEAAIHEQLVQDDDHARIAYQHAQALRQQGVRFLTKNPATRIAGWALPQSPTETCKDMILNPQMDVVEFGDGTGSIEHWIVMFQKIYYDSQKYNSPSYSLVMVDETDGSDPYGGDATRDYDEFGQGFQAPGNLTYLKVSYSRLYANANPGDQAWSNLWMLDSEGNLDTLIAYATIGESPDSWSNRYWELGSEGLAAVSGKPLALVFDMMSSRTPPGEVIWLDDAQVRLCYESGPYTIHLPCVIKSVAEQVEQGCVPLEPDSVAERGSTIVGATCDGSFNAWDTRDYYSANLNGTSEVRLRLFDLPEGTNWDAMIYEDKGDDTYPLACHIGTQGDQDKSTNCTLNPSKDYFVMVNAGTAPSGGTKTYHMSIEQR